MTIASLSFFGFTVVLLGGYYFLDLRKQNWLLLIGSYAFYASWSWQFGLILAGVTLANYFYAPFVEQNRTKQWPLVLGVVANLFVLCLFKYFDFFVESFLNIFGRNPSTDLAIQILLPLGISYYTLECISYLVDINRGKTKATTNLIGFAIYLAYFPKLIAGPIERARRFLPKLEKPRKVNDDTITKGGTLLLLGLFRKLVIADVLIRIVPANFYLSPSDFSTIELLIWGFVLVFQIYNDFAGYTNIARGVSLFFGIELTANFKQPLLATSFQDFWSRWHISLSHWFRDYVFSPLSRSMGRRLSNSSAWQLILIPPILTMMISGLWHQATLSMLLWGLLQGVIQIVERQATKKNRKRPPTKRGVGSALKSFGIALLFLVSGIPFVLDVPTSLTFWQSLLRNIAVLPSLPELIVYFNIFAIFAISIFVDLIDENLFKRKGQVPLSRRRQYAYLAVAFVGIFVFSQTNEVPPFVYQGF